MDDELMNDPYAKKWIEDFNQGLENFWWKQDPSGIGLKMYRGLAVVRRPEENPTWQKWSSRYLYGNPRPRYKAKAYEAPYQFPRDLMEAIEDYAQLYAIDGYVDEFDQDKADAIWEQITAWSKTVGG